MAGSGAGWQCLAASWETSLEMASCTGASTAHDDGDVDADTDVDDRYIMMFVVFGLFTNIFVSWSAPVAL